MKEYHTSSPEETEQVGSLLAQQAQPGSFFALFGDLGAGKTAFCRGFARGLGYTGEVTSPTFALVHEYIGGKYDIFHFDMYRVFSADDLYSTGYFDYEGRGVMLTEWSENIEAVLPADCVRVKLERGATDDDRIISVEGIK